MPFWQLQSTLHASYFKYKNIPELSDRWGFTYSNCGWKDLLGTLFHNPYSLVASLQHITLWLIQKKIYFIWFSPIVKLVRIFKPDDLKCSLKVIWKSPISNK